MFIDLIETFSTRQKLLEAPVKRPWAGRCQVIWQSLCGVDDYRPHERFRAYSYPRSASASNGSAVSRVAVNCARSTVYGPGASLGS